MSALDRKDPSRPQRVSSYYKKVVSVLIEITANNRVNVSVCYLKDIAQGKH